MIQSLGILIGFSWERSFDEAVGGADASDAPMLLLLHFPRCFLSGLAEGHVFGLAPPVLTLLLAIVLASMVPSLAQSLTQSDQTFSSEVGIRCFYLPAKVMPAWKWYILPIVEAHKERPG